MTDQPLYDVAISLLSVDRPFVEELFALLKLTHSVFFYVPEDKRLVGSSAAQSMRAPFRSQSRLNVIVYRKPWGEFGFTKFERDAILGRYMEHNAPDPFLISTDPSQRRPPWFPEHIVCADTDTYTIRQIADQIKARVAEFGKPRTSLTPNLLAKINAENRDYEAKRDRFMTTTDGIDGVKAYLADLFAYMEQECESVRQADPSGILNSGHNAGVFVMNDGKRSMVVKWERASGGPSIRDDRLTVTTFRDMVSLPGDRSVRVYFHGGPTNEPRRIAKWEYVPDLSKSLMLGWVRDKTFWDADDLARSLVMDFQTLSTGAA
jgi:hypothetical protein